MTYTVYIKRKLTHFTFLISMQSIVVVPFGENAKQNSISCFISSAVMFTLWIVIIEIDTVFFPLVARTLCVIAWALGCELMFGSEMQSTVCGGREIIKPQDVWFDVLLNSPPLPTLCYACQ